MLYVAVILGKTKEVGNVMLTLELRDFVVQFVGHKRFV